MLCYDPTRTHNILCFMSTILHRDGHESAFDPATLERSFKDAFQEAGIRDEILIRNSAEKAAETLFELLETESTVPSTRVQAIVVKTLETAKQPEALAAYLRAHGSEPVASAKGIPSSEPLSIPLKPLMSTPTPVSVLSATGESYSPRRRRLNEERKAITHKFQVGGQEGYLTVGLYDDGQPGEIFLKMSKEGSMLSGLMDCFATSISIGLQYGVPLKVMARKFMAVTFEPNGATENPNIPQAHSIVDYVFHWLALKFLSPEERQLIDAELRAQLSSTAAEAESSVGKLL